MTDARTPAILNKLRVDICDLSRLHNSHIYLHDVLRLVDAVRADAAASRAKSEKCPTCDSPAPHLHPAVQYEGEVNPCADAFHKRETPENMRYLVSAPAASRAPESWLLTQDVSLVLARARTFAQSYSAHNTEWSQRIVSEIDEIQKRLLAAGARAVPSEIQQARIDAGLTSELEDRAVPSDERPNWHQFLKHVSGCITCQIQTDRLCVMGATLVEKAEPFDPSVACAVPETQEADEEMVPHAFNSRTPYEPGDDRDIWCKDCEYHRDHEIHAPAVPVQDAPSEIETLKANHLRQIRTYQDEITRLGAKYSDSAAPSDAHSSSPVQDALTTLRDVDLSGLAAFLETKALENTKAATRAVEVSSSATYEEMADSFTQCANALNVVEAALRRKAGAQP